MTNSSCQSCHHKYRMMCPQPETPNNSPPRQRARTQLLSPDKHAGWPQPCGASLALAHHPLEEILAIIGRTSRLTRAIFRGRASQPRSHASLLPGLGKRWTSSGGSRRSPTSIWMGRCCCSSGSVMLLSNTRSGSGVRDSMLLTRMSVLDYA